MEQDPCWKGYKQIGMKKKGKKKVPNCVPTNEEATAGSTSSGSIASVANPTAAHSKPKKRGKYGAPQAPQKRNSDGTAKNALDLSNNLMGGSTIKR